MRLFGNIKFVGELFRRGLLQESIILSVFDMLMAIESREQLQFINDNTVEGAVVLMEKIGHLLDTKLEIIEALEKKATEGGEKLKAIDVDTSDKIRKTFSRFEELLSEQGEPQVSTRQKMLILNMLDDRKTGWKKSKKLEE